MKWDHIIWDWNGTLLNDAKFCYEITSQLFSEIAVSEISYETYRDTLKHPMIDFYRKIIPTIDESSFQDFALKFHKIYWERRKTCELHVHSKNALNKVKELNRSQSILSAHPTEFLNEMVSHHSLEKYFTHVVGASNQLGGSKIDAGKNLMLGSGWDRSNTLLIGDMEHDAEVAKELNINCVLIADGFQSRKVLEATGERVLDSLAELIDLEFG